MATRETEILDSCATTVHFWDCECETDFIHPKTMYVCQKCGAAATGSSDSRVNEVIDYLIKQAKSEKPHYSGGTK